MNQIALMYHDVAPSGCVASSGFQVPGADSYKLDSAVFRLHMEVIARCAEPKKIVLTFDDGGSSALEAAAILEQFGRVGYFFITTGRIGTPGFLTAREIEELRARGHAVGSHSHSHPIRMSRCGPEQMAEEWSESLRRLERILEERVVIASVPGGYYSRAVAMAAAAAGIRTLYTSEPVTSISVVDGCEVRGRFGVQRDTSLDWIRGLADGRVYPRAQRYAFWNLKKALKKIGGDAWLEARERILARRAPPGEPGKGKPAAAGR